MTFKPFSDKRNRPKAKAWDSVTPASLLAPKEYGPGKTHTKALKDSTTKVNPKLPIIDLSKDEFDVTGIPVVGTKDYFPKWDNYYNSAIERHPEYLN